MLMNDLFYIFLFGDYLEFLQFCIIFKLRVFKFDVLSIIVFNYIGQGDLVVYLVGVWIILQLLDIECVIVIQFYCNNFKVYFWLLMLRLREYFYYYYFQF